MSADERKDRRVEIRGGPPSGSSSSADDASVVIGYTGI